MVCSQSRLFRPGRNQLSVKALPNVVDAGGSLGESGSHTTGTLQSVIG